MNTPSAESLLEDLQRLAAPGAGRQAGHVHATRAGRQLNDLVCGSYAWKLFHSAADLIQCAPLLKVMRETGELAERETLLANRDARFVCFWQDERLRDEERRLQTAALYDQYDTKVRRLAEKYRARYEELGRAATDRTAPLTLPRVHARPILQPPLMALLFGACHADKSTAFHPFLTPERGGMEFRRRGDVIQVQCSAPPPAAFLAPYALPEAVRAWATNGVQDNLALLDEMAWDVAALALCAFFTRTGGHTPDEPFLLRTDDYLDWRGIDPRKRSAGLRREIVARMELLCSDKLQLGAQTPLWIADNVSGHRRKTTVVSQGPFLVKRSRLASGDGYLLALGDWARPFVENRAMMGVFCKRLAEYDLRRQQWERRIGWYLVFQFNNQGSKMTFEDVVKDGRERTLVTPQHPFKMRTVLTQSHVPWENMARTNPGKVIAQWCDALGQFRKDGLLGDFSCLDGAPDGSDLPARGRLDILLDRRFRLVPGRLLLPHLRAKQRAASARRSKPKH